MQDRPAWVDRTIAGCYLLGSTGLALLGALVPDGTGGAPESSIPPYLLFPQLLLLLLLVAVTFTALLLRRRYPLTGLIAVLVVTGIAPSDMLPAAGATVAIVILLYSVPVYRSVRAGWVGYGLSVVASFLSVPALRQESPADLFSPDGLITFAITSGLLMLIPVMVGINAGNRRRYTEAIIDRAHQLARERDQLARLAVAEERSRIAREMHDIVAHSVSVMVMLSEGAARAAQIEPAEAARAMEQSAETGRAALAEMRRLIGALRDPGTASEPAAEYEPAPGIDALPELIEGFRAAGLAVELVLQGKPSGAEDQGRELAIYRTVQEALTNTLRHAGPGASATVLVDERNGLVRITDDGGTPGQTAPMTGVGSGQGLVGLAERVRVFGGELEHGPTDSGGWQVTATLPPAGAKEGRHD